MFLWPLYRNDLISVGDHKKTQTYKKILDHFRFFAPIARFLEK